MVGGPARGDATAAALAALPRDTWSVIEHAGWRRASSTYVGHVVVGPSGIFVVDSKAWSGTVEVCDGVLRHDGRARATTVADSADSAGAVARLLPFVPRTALHPVLCFERREGLSVAAGSVLVCTTATLLELIVSAPAVLAVDEVRRVSLELQLALRPPSLAPPAPVHARARHRWVRSA